MHWNLTMTDSYLDFANSPVGARLADALGLPKPLKLERYKPGQPVIKGSVLLGGAGDPQMLGVLAPMFKAMGAQTVAHAQLPQWMPLANKAGLMTGRWGVDGKPGEKVKALVFDATGMDDSTQSDALYTFFHDAARSVLPCGRVVVIGRPPEACANPRNAFAPDPSSDHAAPFQRRTATAVMEPVGQNVPAASTSPFGNTHNQRGWSRPVANAPTARPSAGRGPAPFDQCTAGAISIVGMSSGFGSGNSGSAPYCRASRIVEWLPQAARTAEASNVGTSARIGISRS